MSGQMSQIDGEICRKTEYYSIMIKKKKKKMGEENCIFQDMAVVLSRKKK